MQLSEQERELVISGLELLDPDDDEARETLQSLLDSVNADKEQTPTDKIIQIQNFFHTRRFSATHHLGLGDIRLTLDEQQEVERMVIHAMLEARDGYTKPTDYVACHFHGDDATVHGPFHPGEARAFIEGLEWGSDGGETKVFTSPEDARKWLADQGADELEDMGLDH